MESCCNTQDTGLYLPAYLHRAPLDTGSKQDVDSGASVPATPQQHSMAARKSLRTLKRPLLPPLIFNSHLEYVQTVSDAGRPADRILSLKPLGVGLDIEWRATFQRGEAPRRTATLQICTSCPTSHPSQRAQALDTTTPRPPLMPVPINVNPIANGFRPIAPAALESASAATKPCAAPFNPYARSAPASQSVSTPNCALFSSTVDSHTPCNGVPASARREMKANPYRRAPNSACSSTVTNRTRPSARPDPVHCSDGQGAHGPPHLHTRSGCVCDVTAPSEAHMPAYCQGVRAGSPPGYAGGAESQGGCRSNGGQGRAGDPLVFPMGVAREVIADAHSRAGTGSCDVAEAGASGEEEACWVFRLHDMQTLPPSLERLLVDPDIVKAGVGIWGDVAKLQKDFPQLAGRMQGIVDLSSLAYTKLAPEWRQNGCWSLQDLTAEVLGQFLDKPAHLRVSNWEARPLSLDQLLYAATDACASYRLWSALMQLPDLAPPRLAAPPPPPTVPTAVSEHQRPPQEGAEPGGLVLAVLSPKALAPTKQDVYNMFHGQGIPVEEIARARCIQAQTVRAYLTEAIAAGLEYRWTDFGVPDEVAETVRRAAGPLLEPSAATRAPGGLKALKESLPDSVEYWQIKLVLEHERRVRPVTGVNAG